MLLLFCIVYFYEGRTRTVHVTPKMSHHTTRVGVRHEIVQSLVFKKREEKISARVKLSWEVTGDILPGSRRGCSSCTADKVLFGEMTGEWHLERLSLNNDMVILAMSLCR